MSARTYIPARESRPWRACIALQQGPMRAADMAQCLNLSVRSKSLYSIMEACSKFGIVRRYKADREAWYELLKPELFADEPGDGFDDNDPILLAVRRVVPAHHAPRITVKRDELSAAMARMCAAPGAQA